MKNNNFDLDKKRDSNFDENSDDSSSDSNNKKSRFMDRILMIRKESSILKKTKIDRLTFKNIVSNVFKLILVFPSVVYNTIIDSNKSSNLDDKTKLKKDNDSFSKFHGYDELYDCNLSIYKDNDVENIGKIRIKNIKDNDVINSEDIRKIRVKKIKDIDVSLLNKKKLCKLEKNKISNVLGYDNSLKESNIEIKKEKLKKEILDLIQKKLITNINELEVLHSELYILKHLSNSEVYLDDCQENIDEIKKIFSKVKLLKEKYDYLMNNIDFEYMLEYGDDLLVNKILEFKDICSSDDIRNIIDDYKILDEYKFLYLKIDKFQDNIIKYEEYKSNMIEELRQRDIDFENMKISLCDIDGEKEKYENFLKQQERLLDDLDNKVNKIVSYEEVTYKIKGFDKLLKNSFKYLGLLIANPLSGLIPNLAVQTVVTKNIIKNLYNNLELQEDRKLIYECIDYSTSINMMVDNLDNMSIMIDSSLEDILVLKNRYVYEFGKYESYFSEYKDAINKLNEIEKILLNNKIKVDIIHGKMMESVKQNDDKIKIIKKLNGNVE